MATIKKVRKAQDGETLRGCKIDKQGRKSCGPRQSTKDPTSVFKPQRMSKREQREYEKEQKVESIKTAAKKTIPMSTAPGVRGEKKGSQSFFGSDRDVNEAKYGKKVAKKSAPKKAKVGAKVIKSKKK